MVPLGVPTKLLVSREAGQGLNPTDITVFKGKALFAGQDSSGIDGLWVMDGTAPGTHELIGIKGASANGLHPTDLTVFGKEVLFAGVDAAGNIRLWVTNGTVAGTHEITSGPASFQGGLKLTNLTVFNGEVYFNASGALWVTNGTAAGTHEFTSAVHAPSELAVLVGVDVAGTPFRICGVIGQRTARRTIRQSPASHLSTTRQLLGLLQ